MGARSPARAGYLMTFACIVGIVLSSYGLYVENRIHEDPGFVSLCDLGWASCSKVFTSK
jgi:hypothetical protein